MRAALCIAAASLSLALAAGPAAAGVKVGDRAPELTKVKTAEGKEIRLLEHRGRIVVITFGASWCKPCSKELPALQKIAGPIRKAHKQDVVFIAVNTDEEAETGLAFMKSMKLTCVTVGYDPDQGSVRTYDPDPQPTTYIIDRNGVVRHLQQSYHPGDEDNIARVVNELLAKK
jgi:cytochrome c biogenesis protein CcmG, thiol:disulfide interchange protein DsbE